MSKRTQNRFIGMARTVVQIGEMRGNLHLPGEAVEPMSRRQLCYRLLPWSALLAVGVVLVVHWGLLPPPDRRESGTFVLLSGLACVLLAGRGLHRTLRRWRRSLVTDDQVGKWAEHLAGVLRVRWERETRSHRLQDPVPLPVRWHNADPELSDHWKNIHGSDEPLDLSGQFEDIGEMFARLGSGRLVVLGRAGAGKSVLALRFALDYVRRRVPGTDPVPAIFHLASWDPRRGLWPWAAEQLAADHPDLAARTASGRTIAMDLLVTGRVLPVLDGFDELPKAARVAALRTLNASLGETSPVVLTSRTGQYRSAVAAGRALTRAAAVTLAPLRLADLADYLPRTARGHGPAGRTRWEPVLARLRDEPGPAERQLLTVLSTPLMAVLARAAYSDTGDDPAVLLDERRFRTRESIEEHLLDRLIPAAYGAPRDGLEPRRQCSAEDAEQWFRFLACRLDRLGTQDLAWWRLSPGISRAGRLAAALVVCALPVLVLWRLGLTDPVDLFVIPPVPFHTPLWLASGIIAGIALIALGLGADAGAFPAPRRFRRRASLRRPWRWAVVAGVPAVALLFLLFDRVPAIMLLLCAVLVAAIGLHEPADVSSSAGPGDLLRKDRAAAFTLGGPRLGSVHLVVAGPFGAVLALELWAAAGGREQVDSGARVAVAAAAVAALLLYSVIVSAWGRFAVARVWFAGGGRLPWSLLTFLQDGHSRGVLRQAGGVYRFRHVRLQRRLTTGTHTSLPAGGRPFLELEERGRPVVVAAQVVLLAIGFFFPVSITGAPGAPGPHLAIPPACSLLTAPTFAQLSPGAEVAVQEGGLLSTRDHSCRWYVHRATMYQTPASVELEASVIDPAYGTSALAEAREQHGSEVGAEETPFGRLGGEVAGKAIVGGLGDEAVERIGLGMSWAPVDRHAKIDVRSGNLLMRVTYREEYADNARLIEVAEILTRHALRTAVGTDTGTDKTQSTVGRQASTRKLADIPRRPLPADSRYVRHRSGSTPPHPVVGSARWQPEDTAYIKDFTPFPFAVPFDLACPEIQETPSIRSCLPQEDSTPYFRVRVAHQPCAARCTAGEWNRFDRTWPEQPVPLRPHDPTTRIAEFDVTYDWPLDTPGRPGHGYAMSRVFTGPDGQTYLLGVRIEADPELLVEAQKTLNDIRTQSQGT